MTLLSRASLGCLVIALGISASVSAQSTMTRVSVATGGAQANGTSREQSISANGRYVAFSSSASNLVPGDTNGVDDVFVHDRATGVTDRVSLGPGGVQALGGASVSPSISDDGQFVAFTSGATNLVADDTNGASDIFVRDRQTGTTTRASVATGGGQVSGASLSTLISANGRFVVLTSSATNLVPDDTNGAADVFLHDRWLVTTKRVSVGPGNQQANGSSAATSITPDGQYVVFTSQASNFVPGDTNNQEDVFVRDVQGLITTRVSVGPGGVQGNARSDNGTISADGRVVVFWSIAPSFGDYVDAYIHDRQTGVTTSLDLADEDVGNSEFPEDPAFPRITADGRFVCYTLFTNTPVWRNTILLIDRETRRRTVVDIATNGGLSQDDGDRFFLAKPQCVPNADGSVLAVSSKAPDLVPADTNDAFDVFVRTNPFPTSSDPNPFGVVDTPGDNLTGVTGALPFSGWALDDRAVTRVSICRAAFGAEVAPTDPNCGGAAEIFVGFGLFINGARPDVWSFYFTYPNSLRAGWGFMLLTNMLPNQGNGTYTFTVRAQDDEGRWTVLGRRTMTCTNATATTPFGTIDTPLQGGTTSGSSFVNFGWVLTPQPKTIPFNGSTIHVLINGQDVGTVDYNHARPDIQAAFPGLKNTDGAVGFRVIDTRALGPILHTISWTVTDDQGAIAGIGSRYFRVINSSSVSSAAVAVEATAPRQDREVDRAPLDETPFLGRRGWDLGAPYRSFGVGASGVTAIRGEEVNRVELQLGDGDYTGYLRTIDGLKPLPIGSHLDPATNTFTWAPGVGFIGRYDLVFARSVNGRVVARREVRVNLYPKGSSTGAHVVIDVPAPNAAVRQPFMIGGWAVDLDAPEGTGVSTLHAWAYPASGGAPIFLGAVAHGARPDVAAIHGERFKDSGFGLIAQGLPPGDYDLALFAWSTEIMGFVPPKTVRVSVK
jgi:Tol biopolymer transport system component